MAATRIHADLSLPALVRADALAWVPSPLPGVERRMIERDGDEVARATSIVRYAPGSRFPRHVHDRGEEFLVLDGVFSDEHGDYPAGAYVRNPPGTAHAPSSAEGCTIFVKLRQMDAEGEPAVTIDTRALTWQPTAWPGHASKPLHVSKREIVTVERLDPGARLPQRATGGGEELLVLAGRLESARHGTLGPLAWSRDAAPSAEALDSPDGAVLWVKRGHLRP